MCNKSVIVCNKCVSKDKNLFQKEESIEILKIFTLIKNMSKYQMNI